MPRHGIAFPRQSSGLIHHRCQPTPAPVPAPHHSDGAMALAAGLAVPALAALAL
jgi:hypothetical protein